MCVAAPGLVTELKGTTATVDYHGNKVEANAGIVSVNVGDYVLVHAGLIIQKITKSEAAEMAELFGMFEDLGNA